VPLRWAYTEAMCLTENVLSELRSPARALCDLIEKHERYPRDHPSRSGLGLMIRQLAVELTYLKSTSLVC
jgi:hypothetical protein